MAHHVCSVGCCDGGDWHSDGGVVARHADAGAVFE